MFYIHEPFKFPCFSYYVGVVDRLLILRARAYITTAFRAGGCYNSSCTQASIGAAAQHNSLSTSLMGSHRYVYGLFGHISEPID